MNTEKAASVISVTRHRETWIDLIASTAAAAAAADDDDDDDNASDNGDDDA